MRFTRLEFMNRFTDTELAALYTAAKASVAVEIWLAKFNAAVADADGTAIDSLDPRTIEGLQALEVAGLLDAGRANAILGLTDQIAATNLGKFRVLGVFAESFPLEYSVLEIISGEDGSTTYVLDQGAGGFDPSNLEAV